MVPRSFATHNKWKRAYCSARKNRAACAFCACVPVGPLQGAHISRKGRVASLLKRFGSSGFLSCKDKSKTFRSRVSSLFFLCRGRHVKYDSKSAGRYVFANGTEES